MSSPSSSYGAHSPESSCDASTPSSSAGSSTMSVNAAPTPAKKRSRVSPDDPARQARLAARQARNRQSAQNSRDRKKAEQSAIEEEVVSLRRRNAELEAKVAETEKGISALMDLVKVLMKSGIPPSSPPNQEQATPTTLAPAAPAYSHDSLLAASQPSLTSFTSGSSLASHISPSLFPSTDSLAAPMVPASSTPPLPSLSTPSAFLLSTSSSRRPSSTANVCHPAADIGRGNTDEECERGDKKRRRVEEDGQGCIVDGATWSHHYGSSVGVVEVVPERGLGDGEQGEKSSGGGGQQRQKDSVEQVVKGIKAEQQVDGVPASDEELGQFNHRLASELLEAILGGAAEQQDGAGEGHPQTSYQQQQQEEQGVYGGVEEASGLVSTAPASSVIINNAEPVSTSSWDFNSLGLDLGLDLSVDMNLDLDLNVDQLIHDDSGRSTPLGESADGDAAEQDVDDAVWRGLVDSSLLQVY